MNKAPLKVIRDPVYDYVTIDRSRDGWVLELLSTIAVQRLHRIKQLGVSYVTYPGAEHTRFSHTLGVLHLARLACDHLEVTQKDQIGGDFEKHRRILLAAAVLHDVGHGPFSHVFEEELGGDHESWSAKLVNPGDQSSHGYSEIAGVLRKYLDDDAPHLVGSILESSPRALPIPWLHCLIAGELDLDRLDFLQRDAYFTGAQYGHYDFHRILNSFRLEQLEAGLYPVWPDKSKYAIEEFIFARFYMYRSVYLHPTTRGYEQLLRAVIRRARKLVRDSSLAVDGPMHAWLSGAALVAAEFILLDDAAILSSLHGWRDHKDKALSDLSRRFLDRRGVKPFEVAPARRDLTRSDALQQAKELLEKQGYDPQYYLLEDKGETRYYAPYRPETLGEEGSPLTAIVLFDARATKPARKFREISEVLTRVRLVAGTTEPYHYMFCPEELRSQIEATINRS